MPTRWTAHEPLRRRRRRRRHRRGGCLGPALHADPVAGLAGDWDDRWLVISGKVDLEDRSWSFNDPCLLIEEARELAEWLRSAADGRIERDPPIAGQDPMPSLSFMEPALAFGVSSRNESELTVRIHFTAEGAPPRLHAEDPHHASYIVELLTPARSLLAAADEWTEGLNALPARPWVDPD
jgi:hypothetical protein